MKMTGYELTKYKLRRVHSSDEWGFKITTYDHQTYVTGVYPNTPAAKAGLKINEIIMTVNRVPVGKVSSA